MHWVLQNNLFHEQGMVDLKEYLERHTIPFSEHKVIPFVGDLEPDIDITGPVMCMGSYSMWRVAVKKRWKPGVFLLDTDYWELIDHWRKAVLNDDAIFEDFGQAEPPCDPFFTRPTSDSKFYAGQVMTIAEFKEWQIKVVALGEDDGSGLRGGTPIMMCTPKEIWAEYRVWIVDKRIVTACRYKLGSRVAHSELDVHPGVMTFVNLMLLIWSPYERAFVMDVADTPEGLRVIELNTFNAAGLYKADVGKIVDAIEGMQW